MSLSSKIQYGVAVSSFLAAVGFGIAGYCAPPFGQIHESMLYLIAQFMLLTASIFGVSAVFSEKLNLIRKGKA